MELDTQTIREYLETNTFETEDWFRGFTQGLLLTETLDSHEIERLEDYWNDLRGFEGKDEEEEESF